METINKKDLLPVFKKSRLVEQFDDEITIPKKYVFIDYNNNNKIEINENKTFYKVMDQLRYFMLVELPHEIYDYVLKHKPELSNFKDFFFEELTLLKETNKEELMNKSAKKGYLNLMKYLHDRECSWNVYTCSNAVVNGHLDCLKYAHENGCNWSSDICFVAAFYGHLDCLKYAHENGCSWDSSTCSQAASNGHLDCLKYAHENGCSWNLSTCSSAAWNGHLDCLKYAHENGCSWDSYTCEYAALSGNLDCLKYVIENGCSCNKQTCIDKVREKDHKNIIEYLESI